MVWVVHTYSWPIAVGVVIVGIIAGLIMGGISGIAKFNTVWSMCVFAGLSEGVVWGGFFYGWIGRIVGGAAGCYAGHICASVFFVLMGWSFPGNRSGTNEGTQRRR